MLCYIICYMLHNMLHVIYYMHIYTHIFPEEVKLNLVPYYTYKICIYTYVCIHT